MNEWLSETYSRGTATALMSKSLKIAFYTLVLQCNLWGEGVAVPFNMYISVFHTDHFRTGDDT